MSAPPPRDLILFALFYPYGDYDSYLDEEVRILAASFRRIVVISGEAEGKPARPHPTNVTAIRFNPTRGRASKLSRAPLLFRSDFRDEWRAARIAAPDASGVATARVILDALDRADQYLVLLRDVVASQRLLPQHAVIYNYWMLDNAYASALFKREHPEAVVISRAHRFDLYFDASPIGYLPLKKRTFDGIDAVFFICEHGRRYFRERHGIAPAEESKLRLARLGVPDVGSPPLDVARPGVFRVVSTAFISPTKRIDLIARALALVRDVEIEWVHFGDVYDDPQAFAAFGREVRRLLKDTPNVRVDLKGRLPVQAILDYYRRQPIDLFINVSSSEGIPVSLMEATSAGIPVLATAVCGNPEIVTDENGALLPADPRPEQIADVIRRFAGYDTATRRAFRGAARATWEQHYNAAKNYASFVSALMAMAPEPAPSA